jgi:hypothetical protein
MLALSLAFAQVTVDPAPRVGVETVVEVVDELETAEPGATVQVTHRPGLDGERQIAIGITDSRGRVRWTPEMGGVAILRAGDRLAPVVVGWSAVPPATASLLVLLLLAALGLTGYGLLPRRPLRTRRRH